MKVFQKSRVLPSTQVEINTAEAEVKEGPEVEKKPARKPVQNIRAFVIKMIKQCP